MLGEWLKPGLLLLGSPKVRFDIGDAATVPGSTFSPKTHIVTERDFSPN